MEQKLKNSINLIEEMKKIGFKNNRTPHPIMDFTIILVIQSKKASIN